MVHRASNRLWARSYRGRWVAVIATLTLLVPLVQVLSPAAPAAAGGSPTRIVLSSDPQNGVAGYTRIYLQSHVYDAAGSPVPGIDVTYQGTGYPADGESPLQITGGDTTNATGVAGRWGYMISPKLPANWYPLKVVWIASIPTASGATIMSNTVTNIWTLKAAACDITWIYETSGLAVGGDPVGASTTPTSGCHVALNITNPLALWEHYTIDSSAGVALTADPSTSFFADRALLPPSSLSLGFIPATSEVKYHVDFAQAGDTIKITVDQTPQTAQLNTLDLVLGLIPGTSGEIASHAVEFEQGVLESQSEIESSYQHMPDLQHAATHMFDPNRDDAAAAHDLVAFLSNRAELEVFTSMVNDINGHLNTFKLDVSVPVLEDRLGLGGVVLGLTSTVFYIMLRAIAHFSSQAGWVQVNTYAGPPLSIKLPLNLQNPLCGHQHCVGYP